MPPIRLRTLGLIDLRADSERPLTAPQGKRLALLAYLLAAVPEGPRRRDTLVALLWPELTDAKARNALSQALHHLRRSFGGDAIVNSGAEAIGTDGHAITCDAVELRRAREAGAHERVVSLYGGEFLPGLHVPDAPEFERWVDELRLEMRRATIDSALSLAERALGEARHADAARWANRALAVDGYDDGASRMLLRARLAGGEFAAGLREYNELVARLSEDLELGPSTDLQELARELRRRSTPAEPQEIPVTPAAAASPVTVTRGGDSVGAPRTATRRMRGRWVAASLGVAAAALAIAAAVPGLPGASKLARTRPSLVILPFDVGAAPQHQYLSIGLVHLLGNALDGSDELGPVQTATRNRDSATRRANMNSTPSLELSGSVFELNAGMRVSVTVRDVRTDSVVARADVDAGDRDIFGAVDRLATTVRAQLLPRSARQLATNAASSTQSLPALRAYVAGEELAYAGRYAAALNAFQQAIAQDSTFALAYYRAAVMAEWNDDETTAVGYAARAMQHAQLLRTHDRRLIFAFQRYLVPDPLGAVQLYNMLLNDYPDDPDALFFLGECRFHWGSIFGEQIEWSRPQFTRALELDPDNAAAMLHLARLAAARGDVAELDRLGERVRTLTPASERAVEVDALRAFMHRSPAAEDSVLSRLRDMREVTVDLVARDLAVYARRPDGAVRAARLTFRADQQWSWQNRQRGMVARYLAAQGRWEEAAANLDTAVSRWPAYALPEAALLMASPSSRLSRPRIANLRMRLATADSVSVASTVQGEVTRAYLLALLDVRLGDTVSAAADLRRLESLAHGGDSTASALRRNAAAMLLLARGRAAAALDTLGPAPIDWRRFANAGLSAASPERRARVDALRALGRTAEADRWARTFPDPSAFDLAWRP